MGITVEGGGANNRGNAVMSGRGDVSVGDGVVR